MLQIWVGPQVFSYIMGKEGDKEGEREAERSLHYFSSQPV